MKISAQFATSLHSPEHIAVAEHLGYDRAWLFDTPHESPDVWMMLALAAKRTATIVSLDPPTDRGDWCRFSLIPIFGVWA